MAQGKNKEYIRNPQVFLSNHQINRNPMGFAVDPIPSPGPSNIDLVPAGGPAGVVTIQNYDRRRHGIGAKPIRAYWLPAQLDQTRTITLANAAAYFFTCDLSGCLFAAYYNAAGNLVVEHTNAHGDAAHINNIITPRLTFIHGTLGNGPIRVLTPMPWPAALGVVPAAPHHVVHYPHYAWVIGGRLAGGWRFRYKLSGAPALTPIL